MKIEQTQEFVNVIDHLRKNIMENIKLGEIIDRFIAKKLLPSEELSLINSYHDHGVIVDSLKYDNKEITENPYYKNVKFQAINYNGVRYRKKVIPKGECLSMSYFMPIGSNLKSYHSFGYLNKDTVIPMLVEGKNIWMSPTIAEQRSMQPSIDKAHGNVLTFGLGIGYYPYMCLLKDDVRSVTIVEINDTVIELFEKFILPQFNTDKEIHIIKGDMYSYYNNGFLNKYDSIFVDVWQDNDDGLFHYKKLMQSGVRNNNIDYWIEYSIIEPIKYLMVVYFHSIINNSFTSVMSSMNGDNYRDFKRIHRYFRNVNESITDTQILIDYLNDVEIIRDILSIEI